jgi:DNA polymerase III alpha subunit
VEKMTITNQRIDDYGRVVFAESDLIELFYTGNAQSSDLIAEDTVAVQKYNEWCSVFDSTENQFEVVQLLALTPEAFHSARQTDWLIPPEYLTIDLPSWLHSRCHSDSAHARVDMELSLYDHFQMTETLRLFIYITEMLTANNVLWGVGRGSSVASYCLFIIGVHRVDSLLYDLDIREFLKD